jgi:hypothetical protein
MTLSKVRSLFCLTIVVLTATAQLVHAQYVPEDFAIALRNTPVYESLEIYAEIVATAQPKEYYPLLTLTEDQYGIIWAEVLLDEDTSGFLTDIVAVRRSREELDAFLAEIDIEEMVSWDQESIEAMQSATVEVGLTRAQLLIAAGLPLSERTLEGWKELSFDRSKVLLKNGAVAAITKVEQLPLDKNISMAFTVDDPEFNRLAGQWMELAAGTEKYLTDNSGTGKARFRIELPVPGNYRFRGTWAASEGNSPRVRYRILRQKEELISFFANHRLHNATSIELGHVHVTSDRAVVVEISSEDKLPFSIGNLVVEYMNDPLPTADKQLTSDIRHSLRDSINSNR